MGESYILDSFAILALLNDETGAERVATLLLQAQEKRLSVSMSLINLGEIAYIVERRLGQNNFHTTLAYLESTNIQWAEVTRKRIYQAAHLKAIYPISYADAFAASLAQEKRGILVTADPEFRVLEAEIQIEWLTR